MVLSHGSRGAERGCARVAMRFCLQAGSCDAPREFRGGRACVWAEAALVRYRDVKCPCLRGVSCVIWSEGCF